MVQVAYISRRLGSRPNPYGHRWQRYRVRFLARPENALCRQCKARGLVVAATVVDHIQPHRLRPDLFWDPNNHAPMCGPCHAEKSAREQANYRTGKPIIAKGCGPDGIPLDPAHSWHKP